jgi:hypothetical protein
MTLAEQLVVNMESENICIKIILLQNFPSEVAASPWEFGLCNVHEVSKNIFKKPLRAQHVNNVEL